MAKTIKFNLICDGKPVRTIDDLRENFSIEDVLDYFNNGLLVKWLSVRGYNDEQERVKTITSKDPIPQAKALVSALGIEKDEKSINEGIYALKYAKEREARFKKYKEYKYESESIINDYYFQYTRLLDKVLENSEDKQFIKKTLQEISDYYEWVFKLDHRRVFNMFYDAYYQNGNLLAFVSLLMNKKLRVYYLPDEDNPISSMNDDKRTMYNKIFNMFKDYNVWKKIKDYVSTVKMDTDKYWRDLENEGEYMLLHLCPGDYVRSWGKKGESLDSGYVNSYFPILEGIDYMSNSDKDELVYIKL